MNPRSTAKACGCVDEDAICPCESQGREPIRNPAGLPSIAYRGGDFASVRRALVRHLENEVALAPWRPASEGDLALQVVDWWAYVEDVLRFYNERILNEAFLGTAVLPSSVRRLVATLGHRPRPGIGAIADVALIASGPGPMAVPDRFAVQSKARPGIDPQTFELARGVTFAEPSSAPGAPPDDPNGTPTLDGPPPSAKPGAAEPPAHEQLIVRGGVLLKGKVTGIAVGDRLLLIREPWSAASDAALVVRVTGLVTERDPRKKSNTRVLLDGTGSLGSGAKAKDFRLKRSSQVNHLITVPTGAASITATQVVLDTTARSLKAGQPVLLERPGAGVGANSGTNFDVLRVTAYEEIVWYANGTSTAPTTQPTGTGVIPIPLVLGRLTVSAKPGVSVTRHTTAPTDASVLSGWSDVGALLDTPVTRVQGLPTTVRLARAPAAPAGVTRPALLTDARGNGAIVSATPQAGTSDVTLAPGPNGAGAGGAAQSLQPPLQLLWDLVRLTRGESVRDEVLGTGNAAIPGQDFTLAKFPVTYLADGSPDAGPASRSGEGYSSTVELIVGNVRWIEVSMLFGRRPDERVFMTREDDEGKTHVICGDGVHGARLPTGAILRANYRVGSGALAPAAGTLSQVLAPVPNLSSVRDPAPAYGGSDPDAPEHVREQAPRTVLTFGRAVSATDYEAVAAQAPGVSRASAAWSWDPGQQRPMIRVYVGDDAGAVASARSALRLQSDPNRPVVVVPATPSATALILTLRLDPAYVADERIAAVRTALLDQPDGLFAPDVLRIGETLYRSRIEAACDLPGVLALHAIRLYHSNSQGSGYDVYGPRWRPGEGAWFDLEPSNLIVTAVVAGNG